MNKKVGKLIKRKRKYLKLTQEELAKKLNVSASTISNWETNSNLPEKEMIPKICEVLKINERKFDEVKYKEQQSKFSSIMQNVFEKIISYVLVTILLFTVYTLVHNYKSYDMYYDTYRHISTTADKYVIAEADKNLEIIKNSNGVLDEKAKEEKEKMIKILEAFSYKLHNYKEYSGGNNYQYMKYMSKEFNLFDYSSCSLNDVKDCDIKKASMYSYPIQSLSILVKMDKKINNIDKNDSSYKPLEKYTYLNDNFKQIVSAPKYSIVINAYFPDVEIKNVYGKIIGVIALGPNWPSLNIDQYYLELTKAVMKVGDIHE